MNQRRFNDGSALIHGSCEAMAGLPEESVSLTVTSPPYWNAVDYELHEKDPSQWYRNRDGGPYLDYLDDLQDMFSLVMRATKPGGLCALVIGTVLHKSKHYPVSYDLASRLQTAGWEFHQDITWNKVTGGVKRARLTIQHPYPGYFYPNIMTESILVFRKPGGELIYKNRSRDELDANRYPIDEVFKHDIANNVWHIAPIPPKQAKHPCAFPEEIPYRLIWLYSYKGELVLDPYMGIGSTPKAARALGRRFIGYEKSKRYFDMACMRVFEPLALRPRQLIAKFDKADYTPAAFDQQTLFEIKPDALVPNKKGAEPAPLE